MPRYIRIIFLTFAFMLSIYIISVPVGFIIHTINIPLGVFILLSLIIEVGEFIKNAPDKHSVL